MSSQRTEDINFVPHVFFLPKISQLKNKVEISHTLVSLRYLIPSVKIRSL